jgi:ABC-2 type transport system permease protein
MVTTLLFGWLVFDIDIRVAQPALLVVAIVATVVSIGMLAFLLTMTAVRYRTAWALGNTIEIPIWLICGFLVPLSLLPDWVRPISWVLAPTWGVEAVRRAALGGSPWWPILGCLGLAAVYGAVGTYLAGRLLDSARRHATLALS